MRGATRNPHNRYHAHRRVAVPELMDDPGDDWDEHFARADKTRYVLTHPKTILNRITSPDLRGEWGLNPYQGCEHGCAYCFARNTHNYWGYSAGQDFERVILVKRNAVALLDAALSKPSWRASPLMVSGNTDCYQPVERVERLTRGILELCARYRHPVGLITKNRLILRDLDLLADLARDGLVHVAVSITTLDDTLRRTLEPRTATPAQRLRVIRELSAAGVPVRAMIAPVIPGLTDHEILDIARAATDAGARAIGYTVVRLNGDVGEIFGEWARTHYPERAERILNRIRDCHGGRLNDSRWGTRQKGEGAYAKSIADRIRLARRRFLPADTAAAAAAAEPALGAVGPARTAVTQSDLPPYNTTLFERHRPGQRRLF